ncbi:MAG: DUF2905 domain-containing protein [bacterium]|nr:DUF2905 domain-containing protein [bacterium]
MHETGKYIIIMGIVVIVLGTIVYLGWGPKQFGWFGRLPGDIRYETENTRFYLPIISCIIISMIISIILRIILFFK